jgi:hypothetical protein
MFQSIRSRLWEGNFKVIDCSYEFPEEENGFLNSNKILKIRFSILLQSHSDLVYVIHYITLT